MTHPSDASSSTAVLRPYARRHDLERATGQRSLQRPRLFPWREHPCLASRGLGQDHRHGLGVNRPHLSVGSVVRKPKRSIVSSSSLILRTLRIRCQYGTRWISSRSALHLEDVALRPALSRAIEALDHALVGTSSRVARMGDTATLMDEDVLQRLLVGQRTHEDVPRQRKTPIEGGAGIAKVTVTCQSAAPKLAGRFRSCL